MNSDIGSNGHINGALSEQNQRPLPQSKYLSATTICLSIFALIPLLASLVIVQNSDLGDTHGWDHHATEEILKLSSIMLLSFAVSIVYFCVYCPAVLCIIFDGVLSWLTITKLDDFHSVYPGLSLCTPYRKFPAYPQGPAYTTPPLIYPPTDCQDWKLALKILMGTAAGFAIPVGLVFLGRFLVHLSRSRFWRRDTWVVPPGALIFTVSLKFSRSDSTEPPFEPGRGPIYI